MLGQLGDFFSPEFMNRFDGIIEFSALSKENLLKIVDLMLGDVNQQIGRNEIHLKVTQAAKEKLVDLGYDPSMGARPLRRTIQEHIEDPIADFYIEHPEYKELVADVIDDKIVISNQAQETTETTDEAVPAE